MKDRARQRIASGRAEAAGRTAGEYAGGERRLLDSGERLEDQAIDLNALVEPNIGAILGTLAIAALLLLAIVVLQARRLGRLQRRLDGLTRGDDGRSLEAVLDAHLDKVFQVSSEVDELAARAAVLEAKARRAFQRVGLVRFNPFEDTGGNQSFAIALLDANGDGFVLSSLHARSGTRVYAKTLSNARPETTLSDEEAEALKIALAEGGLRERAAV